MLINREYLELEEISEIEGITKNDLLDLYRRNKIKLYLWCSEYHLIGQIKNQGIEKPFTCGIFSYSGVVEVHNNFIEKLINGKNEVSVKKFTIIELAQITNWKPTKPPYITYPNKQFENHKKLDIPPNFPFNAFLNGKDSESEYSNQIKSLNIFQKNMVKYHGEKNEFDYFKGFKDSINNQVSITPKLFSASDIRFSKSQINALLKTNNTPVKPINKKRSPSPFDQLLITIIQQENLNSGQIWITLQMESKKEIFDRTIDEFGILEEVSHELLIWKNQHGEFKEFKRSGFRKKISQIKRNYFTK